MKIFEDLTWRGLVHSASEGVEKHLAENQVTLYIGFDPTAKSLHVGSLLQILTLARMQRAGHRPIGLVGGGTGLIGDPSGKTAERQLLTKELVEKNLAGIRSQLERFLDFDGPEETRAQMVDNGEWLTTIPMVDFLRDVGKHFTVNYMLAKESVKSRLESEDGLSFTEFSYLLLQSYDFLVLHDRYGCTLQSGASDQWGNITAGTELIRKLRRTKAYGLVSPLVTSSSGVKFGKTESGAVWLDSQLTSYYRFYQFWLNTTDEDVVKYLKYFTFLSHREIEGIAENHDAARHQRGAQKRLAEEMTRMVHGETALATAVRSSEVLFGGELKDLEPAEILDVFEDVPSSELAADDLSAGVGVVDLLAQSGLAQSKGAARRLVREGGAYLNNVRIGDEQQNVTREDFLGGRVLVLRKGRKAYHVVQVQGD
ncbi:MAG: tyrosine--tRNA ligase [Thermoanaerobaculia bacterium]|nr:tyrosine--tRNA ligase [Thermoanaerobaculia bacterium]